ncbi:hypothetical protein [Thermomonas sp. S9]|uniref:hypothetical protein n=1 Tax=Thermomonas sp. S9 TaxID=2885203 RepID=UPI00216B441A|nr:hypothetical protein [Thermomonas sp. S9]
MNPRLGDRFRGACVVQLPVQPGNLQRQLGAFPFQLLDHPQRRCRIRHLLGQLHLPVDPLAQVRLASHQRRARLHVSVAFQRAAKSRHQFLGQRRRCQVVVDLAQYRVLDGLCLDAAPRAAVPVLGAFAAPCRAGSVHQQAGQQRAPLRARAGVALAAQGLQPGEQQLGRVVVDHGRVRVSLDDPLAARAPLAPADVLAALTFGVDVPDRVPGIGEGVPFEADARCGCDIGQPRLLRCHLRLHPAGARLQVGGDLRRNLRVQLQHGLGHRRAVADRPGCDLLEPVAQGRPAARAIALAHVLGHARQPLLLRREAVPLVQRLHDPAQQGVGDRVRLRHVLVEHADARFAACVLEEECDVSAPGNAAGVVDQHCPPAAARIPDACQQALESGAVVVLS